MFKFLLRLFGIKSNDKVNEIIAKFDWLTLIQIVDMLDSKENRRDAAIYLLLTECQKRKIPMDEATAAIVVDKLAAAIRKLTR